MNIVVCMKQTPDTEAKIVVQADGKDVEKDKFKYIISTYDELAVEEGIRLKEKFGGNVTVVTVGPAKTHETLRSALAMGADNAIQIWDDSLENADSYTISKLLAAAIKTNAFDVVIAGQKAIDTGAGLVGGMVAEFLNVPQVSLVTKLEAVSETTLLATRQVEGGEEVVEVNVPALVTAQRGLNTPRYIKLPDIMKAKKKELKTVSPADSGLAGITSKVSTVSMSMPPAKQAGKILTNGEADVAELVRLLKEEAKVI